MSGAMLKHFRKELLRPATVTDERGRLVTFTAEQVLAAGVETSRMIGDGVKIPVVTGDVHPLDVHESTPSLATRREVVGYLDMAAVLGGRLMGDIQADADLLDTDVSIWIEPKVTAPNGRTYGPAIRHVLLTSEPALRGQAPFALLKSRPAAGEKQLSVLLENGSRPETKLEFVQRMNVNRLSGHLLSNLLTPPEENIPPEQKALVYKILAGPLKMTLSNDELLEVEQHLIRYPWVSESDAYDLAEMIGNLVDADRIAVIADEMTKSAQPEAMLSLGWRQSIPDESIKLIMGITEKIGITLSSAEQQVLRSSLWSHAWGGSVTVFTVAKEIVASWISNRVREFRQKKEGQSAVLSAHPQSKLESIRSLRPMTKIEALRLRVSADRDMVSRERALYVAAGFKQFSTIA